MLLQSCERNPEARDALARGQRLARQKGDSHTLSELTAALEAMG